MAITDERPVVTAQSLQGRVARAMYDAITTTTVPPSFEILSRTEQHRFERMAAAACSVILREPPTG